MMTEPRQIGTARTHEATDLLEARRALRALVDASGMAMLTIDELAGLPRGYTAKVLGNPPLRGLSSQSIFLIAATLGHKIAFIPDERAARRIKAHHAYQICDDRQKRGPEHFRNAKALSMLNEMAVKNGKIGAIARMQKLTPKQRSRIARKAARARWSKPRVIRVFDTSSAASPRVPEPSNRRPQSAAPGAGKALARLPSPALPG